MVKKLTLSDVVDEAIDGLSWQIREKFKQLSKRLRNEKWANRPPLTHQEFLALFNQVVREMKRAK